MVRFHPGYTLGESWRTGGSSNMRRRAGALDPSSIHVASGVLVFVSSAVTMAPFMTSHGIRVLQAREVRGPWRRIVNV